MPHSPSYHIDQAIETYWDRFNNPACFESMIKLEASLAGLYDISPFLSFDVSGGESVAAGLVAVGSFDSEPNKPVAVPWLTEPGVIEDSVERGRHHIPSSEFEGWMKKVDFTLESTHGDAVVYTFSTHPRDNYATVGKPWDCWGWLERTDSDDALRQMSSSLPEVEFCLRAGSRAWLLIQAGQLGRCASL